MAKKKPTNQTETVEVIVELDHQDLEEGSEPDFPEDTPEIHQEPVEATTPVQRANTYVTQPGDSYASLAASLSPVGTKKHDYAKALAQLNGPLRAGRTIQLP